RRDSDEADTDPHGVRFQAACRCDGPGGDATMLPLPARCIASRRREAANDAGLEAEMSIDRRQFLMSAAVLAAPARTALAEAAVAPGSLLPPSVRADFPIASAQTYLNSAAIHPMSVPASRALEAHIQFRLKGGGEGRADFGEEPQKDLKRRFAQLIGAKPNE